MKKKALGKGLSALFPDSVIDSLDTSNYEYILLPLDKVVPNPFQPRKVFELSEIESLAISIKNHGVIQPILVRKSDNVYEIVAGERRWRAASLANLESIPALLISESDQKAYEIALIENIQRVELNAIEEALAYETLISKYSITQAELATVIGKSRSQITNTLRLLSLDDSVKEFMIKGLLTHGHARALVPLDSEKQKELCYKIVKNGLSVREVENIISKKIQGRLGNEQETLHHSEKVNSSIVYSDTVESLSDYLGSKVTIDNHSKCGKLVIEFYGDSDLERIIEIIVKK